MRKWTYLVAALLMSGTAATVTSCIDSDEPFGVESMRTAKAEFYKAQAAVKNAEVAYQNALAEFELQLVEEMKLKNKALDLANELQSANNDKDKAALTAAIEELQAQHAVKMQQIAADKAMADAAYENALKELALTISAVNGEYTAEYARLLAKVTDNRAKYNMYAAQVTDKSLLLMQNTASKLDTASVRLELEANVTLYQGQLDYLNKQKTALQTASAPDVDAATKMADLDKQIRELVVTYNTAVNNYNTLNARLATENTATANERNAQGAANKDKYSAAVSASIAVPAIIQDKFITDQSLTGEKALVTKTEVNGQPCYALAAELNGVYTVKQAKLTTPATIVSNSTTQLLITALAPIETKVKAAQSTAYTTANINSVSKEAFDLAYAKLPSYQNALANLSAAYDKDKAVWEAAKTAYFTAYSAYMYDSRQTYFEYVQAYKSDVYDPAITAAGTDAAKLAAKTAFLPILKAYATARQALDGWAYADGNNTADPLYTTIAAADIDDTSYGKILGSAALINDAMTKPSYKDAKTYDKYPFGAFAVASTKAFGVADRMNVPVDADELFAPTSIGGSYGKYFAQLQQINNLNKAKAWNDLLAAVVDAATEPTNTLIAWAKAEAPGQAKIDALQDIADATQREMDAIKVEVATTTTTPTAIKVVYDAGTAPAIKKNTISVANAAGQQGTYITSLVNIHNGLATGIDDFNTELAAIDKDITDVTKLLASAKDSQYKFENGGYAPTGLGEVSVEIAAGIEVSWDPDQEHGDDNYGTITVTVSRPTTVGGSGSGSSTPGFNNGVNSNTTSTFELTYKDPRYAAVVSAIKDAVADELLTFTPTFLKSWIEAQNAEITQLEGKMEDLNKELVYIQNELNAFLKVIEAKLPTAAQ